MNKRTKRGLVVGLAVALLASVGVSTPVSAAKGDGPSVDATPVANLKKGGTFVWAINDLPDNFNPSQIDGNTADTAYIMGGTLPGFFYIDANGAWQVDKNYASKVELTSTKPQVVTYTLNPKAKWSDGKSVGLADFQGYWKALNGSNAAYEVPSNAGYEDIGSIRRGASANQIVVTFKTVYADWIGLFGGLLPASLTKDPATFNTSWKNAPGVSAGPFIFQSVNLAANTVTMVPNKNWWGDKPVLDRFVYRAIPPATQMDALANGEVDYIDIGPDANAFARAKTLKGVSVHVSKAPNFRHMTFGSGTPIIRELAVRQAIMMAMNRNAITKAMIGTIDRRATSLDNHIFVKGLSCYTNNSGNYGKFSIKMAKETLDKAGWTGSPRTKNGQQLKVAITIPSGVPTSAQEAQLMQSTLAQAGIALEIRVVPLTDFFSKYILPGDYEMTVFSWIGTPLPISSSVDIYRTTGGSNFGQIGSKKIDALLTQANTELDQVKRCRLANQADKLIWEIGHSTTNYQRPNVTAKDKNLKNMGSWGFSSMDYTKVGFAK
jgi:peptide/nickel transport system substrate-binding protein